MRKCRIAIIAVVLASIPLAPMPVAAQTAAPATDWTRRAVTIPMRDGVKLHTVIVSPANQQRPLPIMLLRTPYGVSGYLEPGPLPPMFRELAEDGYIFVMQDIRGRFMSEGEYLMVRPLHHPTNPKGTDESTDAYDTVDWLVKHVPQNNGRVGVIGVSYPGWLAAMAGIHPHPAVRAISQAPMTDTWLGDDFFHQGAFRQTSGLVFAALMEFSKDFSKEVVPARYDLYDWYLQFPTLDSLAKATGVAKLPTWAAFRAHPAWDDYWQARALQRLLTKPAVPTLIVGGLWDQEDLFGAQELYRTLEPNDKKRVNHLVLGPWHHGQWSRPGGESLGPIQFGGKTADHFRANIQRPWFAYYLHGIGDSTFAEAQVFEAGANRWRSFDSWPPRGARAKALYLHSNGVANFIPPLSTGRDAQPDVFVSDPRKPVPYMPRPVEDSRWREWLVQDQRFVDNRPDVLTWQTAPLDADVSIAGNIVARLFASTSGTDADWVVKLIDVYPEDTRAEGLDEKMAGYELMVAMDIMRGRYRKSWTKAEPIPANTVTPFTVDLHQQMYRFRKGHRIMVQVQSTLFPLYDRNPQTFVPNIFRTRPGDFKAQTHRIWHLAKWPSNVEMMVIE